MSSWRLHITGASCSGVSTLGAALAEHLSIPRIDVDDFYWMLTDPPFTTKRPVEDRVGLIRRRLEATEGWVLTGSCMAWGDILICDVHLIIFVYTPTAVRLHRLDQRETARYGDRISPGGDMREAHLEFREWASCYEDPTAPGRNLAKHERWLAAQSASVLRLDGVKPTRKLLQDVQKRWQGFPMRGRVPKTVSKGLFR